MPADEADKFCKENQVQTMLPKIIKTGFQAVQLIYFFTAGEDEVKCWQIRKGLKAPQVRCSEWPPGQEGHLRPLVPSTSHPTAL